VNLSDSNTQSTMCEGPDFSIVPVSNARVRHVPNAFYPTRGNEGNEYVVLEAYEFDVRPVQCEAAKIADAPRRSRLQTIRLWLC
jgi:hypothetical protein